MSKQVFINLPVKDLNQSMDFFKKLGFAFNPQFTNEQGACMIIDENHIYAMLITHELYKTFISKEVADATKTSEVIVSLNCATREEVESMINSAIAAGAVEQKSQDLGWMYQKGFLDLDGHHWEAFFMDPSAMPQQA